MGSEAAHITHLIDEIVVYPELAGKDAATEFTAGFVDAYTNQLFRLSVAPLPSQFLARPNRRPFL